MNHRQKIRILQRQLSANSSEATKVWFENYLKGAISYRGLKTPQIITLVKDWRRKEKIAELAPELQLELALELLRQEYAEDKFAGIMYLQNFLLKEIDFAVLAHEFENLFRASTFGDWSTTDWFNVRVLSPLIELHDTKAIKRFTSWYKSSDLWQRRSSIVSLRACVKNRAHLPTIERQIARLVASEERFIQTGIGWVIADLSKHFPAAAASIVERHLKSLSPEVLRRHTKNLPKHRQYLASKKAQSARRL